MHGQLVALLRLAVALDGVGDLDLEVLGGGGDEANGARGQGGEEQGCLHFFWDSGGDVLRIVCVSVWKREEEDDDEEEGCTSRWVDGWMDGWEGGGREGKDDTDDAAEVASYQSHQPKSPPPA